jgi:hypothetical protein
VIKNHLWLGVGDGAQPAQPAAERSRARSRR